MNLNTSRILNTDTKVLVNALHELAKTENTLEAAKKYCELYKDKPLSFIIDNSEQIFVEPRVGLEFYKQRVGAFPLHVLCDELTKVTNYVHDHKDQMHPVLAESYGGLIAKLRDRIHNTNAFGVIEDTIIGKDPSYRGKIQALCELLYKIEEIENDDSDTSRTNIDIFNNLNKLVASLNPVVSLIYICVSPHPRQLKRCARNIAKSLSSGSAVETLESAVYLGMLRGNALFTEAMRDIASADARCILEGLATTNVIQEFDTYAEETMVENEEPRTIVTLDNFIEAAMTELQEERSNTEYTAAKRGILTDDKLRMYESVLSIVMTMYERCEPNDIMQEFPVFTQIKESVGIHEEITVEDALKIITEATSSVESELDALMQEYTIDGRPGGIVSKHNAGAKYNEDITKGIDKRPKASAPSRSGAFDDYDDEEENSEVIPASSRFGSEGMPDASDPNTKKPKKPKQGVLGKVTTKAMDAQAARTQWNSKIKAAGQSVTTAGKAVLKVPAGILKGIGNFGKFIEQLDDDRRKEYMIRPGFRKKIFKNIRVAAMYGATAYVNKLYLPIAWFARKMSKEKNKRIRDTFAAELETEIKVTEAKIEDATSKGDQEQRYQLMRIRDKLARDLARVKYNSKYL